ncbi:MAG: F0F1 ATP synthase subunit delta, partial [Rhodobacteraceae bacterium]|nr:F0F1 ATP synthase subunit delta [Paracoccaceae bacterium]MCB2157608.1 F0F1 ATP synthase subunit delta [Paracoccaceae bacterium]
MSEPASISAGIAGRYATAVFELAREAKDLKALEADVDALQAALDESADLRSMIASPVYSRDAQSTAVAALAKAMKLSGTVANTLALMASNRRLFVLPQLLSALRDMIA